ncbi:MAG: acyltransferase [Cyclobacteriaceae bacterium]
MHQNNFNLLRLLFATMVLVTHSYTLSNGSLEDWLTQHTSGQISFSFIGLSGFFIISGYLVFQSLERNKNLIDYFKRRILRICPGLFVVLLLTVLLGVFVYEGSFKGYVTNHSVWTYLPRNFFLVKPQGSIPGIFTSNPYGDVINGSLWSLLYECSFYFFLASLFYFRKQIQFSLLIVAFTILLIARLFWFRELSGHNYILASHLVLEFFPFFVLGALLAALKIEKLKLRMATLVMCVLTLILFTALNSFEIVKFFLLPPTVILMGLGNISQVNRLLTKLGDISYGVYIYAFPIQQTLVHFFKLDAQELMLIALPVSFLLGYLSWHFVEKRALQLK